MTQLDYVDVAQVDARALRDVFGAFLTGVTIVSAFDENGVPRGFTANSFTSVSLDPPLVLVCVANTASSHALLANCQRFGINVLAETQRDLSTRFASRMDDKFAGVSYCANESGPPLIDGSLAGLDCERQQIVAAGDHSIVIGRVMGISTTVGRPLGYYRGNYVAFGLGTATLGRHGSEAVVLGCVLGTDDSVLLCRRPGQQHWEIPSEALGNGDDHRSLLPRLLRALNIQAELSLLYSVFQDKGDSHLTLVFKGEISSLGNTNVLPDGTALQLFREEERPWELVRGPSMSSVIRRFFDEAREARFGIYWETEGGGHVASVEGRPKPWLRASTMPEQ